MQASKVIAFYKEFKKAVNIFYCNGESYLFCSLPGIEAKIVVDGRIEDRNENTSGYCHNMIWDPENFDRKLTDEERDEVSSLMDSPAYLEKFVRSWCDNKIVGRGENTLEGVMEFMEDCIYNSYCAITFPEFVISRDARDFKLFGLNISNVSGELKLLVETVEQEYPISSPEGNYMLIKLMTSSGKSARNA